MGGECRPLPPVTFNLLLSICGRAGDLASLEGVLHAMGQQGLELDQAGRGPAVLLSRTDHVRPTLQALDFNLRCYVWLLTRWVISLVKTFLEIFFWHGFKFGLAWHGLKLGLAWHGFKLGWHGMQSSNFAGFFLHILRISIGWPGSIEPLHNVWFFSNLSPLGAGSMLVGSVWHFPLGGKGSCVQRPLKVQSNPRG